MNATMVKMTGKLFIFWKRHGATISVTAGALGLVAAGVTGAVQWVKCKRVIDECNEDLDKIQDAVGKTVLRNGEEYTYTEEDAKKDRSATKRKMIIGCARHLAGPVGLTLGSGGLIFYGIRDFKKQIASGLVYASSLEQLLSQRDAILRKELGDEKVDMLYEGFRQEQKENIEIDPETGVNKVTLEDQLRKEFDITPDNVMTFKYGYGCSDWTPGDRLHNMKQLRIAEEAFNATMAIRGYATGTDILECCGIPFKNANGATQIVGSVWDKNKTAEDNHVRFHVIENGSDEITFTVQFDGIVLDKIKKVNKDNKRKLKKIA